MPHADCPQPIAPNAEEDVLARGVVYRFLATAFRLPEDATAAAQAALAEALEAAFESLQAGGWPLPAHVLGPLRQAARDPAARRAAYLACFGHGVRGACAPYEGEYGAPDEGLYQPHELADLAAFYRAFGLTLAPAAAERVDHVALEAEFCSFLCQKEAHALAAGDGANAELVRAARREFLSAHLGRWLPTFLDRLSGAAPDPFLVAASELGRAFVALECASLDAEPGEGNLPMRPASFDPENCLKCPMSEACDPKSAAEAEA